MLPYDSEDNGWGRGEPGFDSPPARTTRLERPRPASPRVYLSLPAVEGQVERSRGISFVDDVTWYSAWIGQTRMPSDSKPQRPKPCFAPGGGARRQRDWGPNNTRQHRPGNSLHNPPVMARTRLPYDSSFRENSKGQTPHYTITKDDKPGSPERPHCTRKGTTILQGFTQMTKIATRRWLLQGEDWREKEDEWGVRGLERGGMKLGG